MSAATRDVLTIGQLASSAGVTTSAIRYYERRGLLTALTRTRSNYRTYSADAVERLKFIRNVQENGFSLSDIRQMLALGTDDERPCRQVASLIEYRLADVRARACELQEIERRLVASAQTCCTKSDADLCSTVSRLAGRERS